MALISDLTSTGMLLSHIKQPELTLLYQRVPSSVLLRHAEQYGYCGSCPSAHTSPSVPPTHHRLDLLGAGGIGKLRTWGPTPLPAQVSEGGTAGHL